MYVRVVCHRILNSFGVAKANQSAVLLHDFICWFLPLRGKNNRLSLKRLTAGRAPRARPQRGPSRSEVLRHRPSPFFNISRHFPFNRYTPLCHHKTPPQRLPHFCVQTEDRVMRTNPICTHNAVFGGPRYAYKRLYAKSFVRKLLYA